MSSEPSAPADPAETAPVPEQTPAAASVFSVELLAEFVRHGVTDFVVCPGSRSQALALAAAAAEQAGAIRLHVHIDERAAAFFSLGVARETGMPAPIIVTSGTAVANLLPAALEAHEGRVPFIALTADRPAELRGIRSNQTTRQAHLWGASARLSLDVEAPEWGDDGDIVRDEARDPAALAALALSRATGFHGDRPPGPVQLNLAFREPLSGTAGFDEMIRGGFVAAAEEPPAARRSGARTIAGPEVEAVRGGFRTHTAFADADIYEHDVPEAGEPPLAVVIAGAGAGPEAEEFAHMAGLPLLAEVVSGVRYGREAIAGYTTLLAERVAEGPVLGDLVERAIVFGHPTLTRQIPMLLQRDDVEVIVVDPFGGEDTEHYNPGRRARIVRSARIAVGYDPRRMRKWLGAWVVADRELLRERTTVHEPDLAAALENGYRERSAYARAEVATMREPVTRELLAESVWRATWPHDRLVLAASRLVRVLDRLAPSRKVHVHANRGLAGIDGTVATALGIAAASQAGGDAGATRVLIGDLATLHDSGSLLLRTAEPRPRIQLFVGNDGGGTIFEGLEVAGSAGPAAFERVMRTPQAVDFAALAGAYGWEYRRADTRGALESLLTEAVTGPSIVEVPFSD